MTVKMVPYAATEPSSGGSGESEDGHSEFGDIGSGECFCARFHADMSLLAASYADGTIRVFDPIELRPSVRPDRGPSSGPPVHRTKRWAPLVYTVDPRSYLPTMSVRFRPGQRAKKAQSNVLVSVGAAGAVQHWHLGSQKCLHSTTEEGVQLMTKRRYTNQIFALEYSPIGGTHFATAGKDYKVRVYDEATKSCTTVLAQSLIGTQPGHSNCVFSVKWHPTEPHTLFSAGWDNTVCIWDTRLSGGAVRSLHGPHICGDALDVEPEAGREILTGSYRPEDQLQLWDSGSGRLISTFDWPGPGRGAPGSTTMLYAAQFSADGKRIAAGGSGRGRDELRVYDRQSGKAVGIAALDGGCYCLDWASNCETLVAGLSDGSCQLFKPPPV
eukprot:SAG22_NODE_71_length_22540_cov_8.918052_2_plen_384_part_00